MIDFRIITVEQTGSRFEAIIRNAQTKAVHSLVSVLDELDGEYIVRFEFTDPVGKLLAESDLDYIASAYSIVVAHLVNVLGILEYNANGLPVFRKHRSARHEQWKRLLMKLANKDE